MEGTLEDQNYGQEIKIQPSKSIFFKASASGGN